MMSKRIVAVLMVLTMMVSLNGCIVRRTIEAIEASEEYEQAEKMFGEETAREKEGEPERSKEVFQPEETETEAKTEDYVVGDYVFLENGFRVCLLKCGTKEAGENGTFDSVEEGKRCIWFDLYVENGGDYKETISWMECDCYADGYRADYHYYGQVLTLDAELMPGRATVGRIAFDVPEDAKEIKMRYAWNWGNDGEAVFLYEDGRDVGGVPEPARVTSEGAVQKGETYKTDLLEVTYKASDVHNEVSTKPKEGMEHRAFAFDVKNLSSEDRALTDVYECRCYADGMYCKESPTMFELSITDPIAPGMSNKGNFLFEVPVDAEVIEMDLLGRDDNVVTFRVQ